MGELKIQQSRCSWCTSDALYIEYHDHEWGRVTLDDQALFERLALEGMQAGLSWLTVLKKRQAMQRQFGQFDIAWLAKRGATKLDQWLANADLIRHRGKLEAMLHNARLVHQHHRQAGSFAQMVWSFAPATHVVHQPGQTPAFTKEATAMAKHLKQAGFRFVGPTTCYAFMQSVGMVNDHVVHCLAYHDCLKQWTHSMRPTSATAIEST